MMCLCCLTISNTCHVWNRFIHLLFSPSYYSHIMSSIFSISSSFRQSPHPHLLFSELNSSLSCEILLKSCDWPLPIRHLSFHWPIKVITQMLKGAKSLLMSIPALLHTNGELNGCQSCRFRLIRDLHPASRGTLRAFIWIWETSCLTGRYHVRE